MSVLRSVGWYVRELMGDNDYERYVAHLGRHHPDLEPLSEREYWRGRYARQDVNPGARCC